MTGNKVFNNAKWIIACKIVQSLLQLVVGMLSARYLGPSNYGLINYASSVVAFFVPIMQLGLRNTLVQEYVEGPDKEGEILGTSMALNMLSSVACIIGVTAFAAVANMGETVTIWVCALYSVSLLFQAMEMLQFWFQAKLLSKYSSLAMLFSYLVVSAYKIYLLASGKSVYWFALSHAVEYACASVFMLVAYKKQGTQKISVSMAMAKKLLSKSKYYIAAALMVVVYTSTGGVLLKFFHSEAENGFYSAAVTCTAITGFVFAAIIDTARPVILEKKQQSQEAFEKSVSITYCMLNYLALAQSIVLTALGGLVIKILYGDDYLPAIPVLQILNWNVAFSHMGSVRNIWILGEEKHKVLWIINAAGAGANILVNLCLIPIWGACGAAVAAVVTQIFTNFIMGFVLKEIRPNNRLIFKSLNPRLLIEMLDFFKRQEKTPANTQK